MKNFPLIAVSAALVTACGGGGGGNSMPAPPPPANVSGSDVPVSATQDPNAAFQFVSSLSAKSSDGTDPITVGDATLATSETDEPAPL
jgi:hypothetical protein